MTTQQLEATGFVFDANTMNIEQLPYREYLDSYGTEETTTPNGNGSKLHVVEVGDKWDLRKWGPWGNGLDVLETFESEEDAVLAMYDNREWYVREKNWDAPAFQDRAGAVQDMADALSRTVPTIERYLRLKKAAETRQAREKAEEEAAKEQLRQQAKAEADNIPVDEIFKKDVAHANAVGGKEKQGLLIGAMKGLLQRNGRDKIDSDFWQVVRILKAKASYR